MRILIIIILLVSPRVVFCQPEIPDIWHDKELDKLSIDSLSVRIIDGNFYESISLSQRAIDRARELNKKEAYPMLYLSIGQSYIELHKYTNALEYLEKALGYFEKTSKNRLRQEDSLDVNIYMSLGLANLKLDQYSQAIKHLKRSIEITENKGIQPSLGLHLLLAEAYYNIGMYDEALKYSRKSLQLYQDIKDLHGQSRSLTQIGLIYSSLGLNEDALFQHKLALEIFESKEGESEYTPKSEREKEISETLDKYFEKQYLFAQSKNDKSNIQENIGSVYLALNKPREAIEIFERSLISHRYAEDKAGAARAISKIGTAYSMLDNAQDDGMLDNMKNALNHHYHALKIHEEINDISGQISDYINLGMLYLNLGNNENAKQYFEKALELSTTIESTTNAWQIWYGLAKVYSINGNARLAILFGKHAINSIQKLRKEVNKLYLKEQRNQYLFNKHQAYYDLADLLISEGRLIEAKKVLELFKQEEYLDFVRGFPGDLSQEGVSELNPKEKNWTNRYEEIKNYIITRANRYERLIALEQSKTLAEDESQELSTLRNDMTIYRKEFLSFLTELQNDFAQANPDAQQALGEKQLKELESFKENLADLGTDVALVDYIVTEKKLHIIFTTSNTPPLHREVPISRVDLNKAIFGFREAIINCKRECLPENETRMYEFSKMLYSWLINPIADDLRQADTKTIMVYLDRALRYLPYGALYDGRRWFSERYALAIYTAAASRLLSKKPSRDWHVAGLGLTKSINGFQELVAVDDELNSIVNSGPPDPGGILKGKIYVNEDFTPRSIQKALESGIQVLHIASHFVFTPGTDVDSYLLTGDGKVTLKDINEQPFRFNKLELFTLSACNTALGDEANGSEVEGLGTLIQRRGAKSVMATLWEVNDSSTGKFMVDFYANRVGTKNPISKAKALQATQQKYIDAERSNQVYPSYYARPYFWAPFILMGNWL